eukprot:Skav209569  [mRNA]  locus=scaffold281:125565:126563:- [translate_table: standard]
MASGDFAELLFQIKEDSGAATRVSNEGKWPSVEIAGSCSSKLHALLDLSALLWQHELQPGAPGEVKVLLRSQGPCGFTAEEALRLARTRSVTATASVGGDRLGIQLLGSQVAVCSTAILLCREAEQKAWFNERKHGPPALLVDYLSRWFGRDAGQLLQQRQRRTKRGQDDLLSWVAADDDVKKPRTAAQAPMITVEGPPLPQDEDSAKVPKDSKDTDASKADASSSDEDLELPSAETLPLFVDRSSLLDNSADPIAEEEPASPPRNTVESAASSEEEPVPPGPTALATEQPAVEADDDLVSDSDSDYYRPGPQEDPLWAKRQEILKKLKASG